MSWGLTFSRYIFLDAGMHRWRWNKLVFMYCQPTCMGRYRHKSDAGVLNRLVDALMSSRPRSNALSYSTIVIRDPRGPETSVGFHSAQHLSTLSVYSGIFAQARKLIYTARSEDDKVRSVRSKTTHTVLLPCIECQGPSRPVTNDAG